MIKKSLLVIICALLFSPVFAEEVDLGGHAGTPPGFYDDINPDDLEEEVNITPHPGSAHPLPQGARENDEFPNFYEDEDGVFIPAAPKAKPTKNYSQIYNDLEPADFSYLHNIDPDQFYDMKDTTWSTYPLLRLISPIYFKNITIEPGYYLLTPREQNGKWYMLFKQNGIVMHIIPVYERDYTPEMFYDEHIPKPKLTTSQKIHMGFLDLIGKIDSTKRKAPVETYLEVNDLENYFVSIIIYYGSHKYSTLFRTIKL